MIINTEKCIFSYAVHSIVVVCIALMYNTTHYIHSGELVTLKNINLHLDGQKKVKEKNVKKRG